MSKQINNLWGEKGSMMVEALAMLGLITMVTPILYKKAAERTTELQDINTAAQMRTLSKALDDYIQDNYAELAKDTEGEYVTVLTPEEIEDELLPYLPYNFKLQSRFYDDYKVAYRNDVQNFGTAADPKIHSAITGMILANSKEGMPMVRAAKIASMIGANGGVVRDKKISGVQGAWEADLGDYDFDDETQDGSLAVSSVHAIASEGGGASSAHVLYRDDSKGDEDYNRMQVDLLMNGNNIREVVHLLALPEGDPDLGNIANEVIIDSDVDEVGSGKAILSVKGKANVADLFAAGALKIGNVANRDVATPSFSVDANSINAAKKVTINTGAATNPSLEVTGTTTLTGDTTVTGKTKVTSGSAILDVGSTTANAVTIKAPTNISGATTINGQTTVKGTATATSGVSGDADKYILSTEGNLLVSNNARVKGKLTVATLEATNVHATGYVYADTNLKAGLSGNTYNLNVDSAGASLKSNAFTVGNRIVTDNTSAALYGGTAAAKGAYKVAVDGSYAGIGNFSGSTAITSGFTASSNAVYGVAPDRAKLRTDHGMFFSDATRTVVSKGTSEDGTSNAQYLNLQSGSVQLGNTANTIKQTVTMNSDGITLDSGNKAKAVLDNGAAIFTADNLQLKSNSAAENATNPTIFEVNDNQIAYGDSVAGLSVSNDERDEGVIIRRSGIIQLPRATVNANDKTDGKMDTAGYIRADRLLSNVSYKDPAANINDPYYDYRDDEHAYDAYQVNPAYTSVMHDIKLTTRGGARLSDILPDFINKGIYVIDNTYAETKGKEDWDKYEVDASTAQIKASSIPSNCSEDDARCIATPWMGFVPTPLCPPGYSKVITINPIRWKMAEAFVVTGDNPNVGDAAANFRAYFSVPTDPGASKFELNSVSGSGSHTHTVADGKGWPLTFQTNTWLNTTISGVRSENGTTGTSAGRYGDFLGWHAIMGFLYYADEYKEYLQAVGATNLSGKVVWNLFPVYNEEMTAIADVYCYFERRSLSNPNWGWQSNLVHNYDQMANFRSGFDKSSKGGSGYVDRLNDPALEYNDPW